MDISGSPTLVRSLLGEGLLDELRLMVHPVVVGGEKRLFEEGAPKSARARRLEDVRHRRPLSHLPAGRTGNRWVGSTPLWPTADVAVARDEPQAIGAAGRDRGGLRSGGGCCAQCGPSRCTRLARRAG